MLKAYSSKQIHGEKCTHEDHISAVISNQVSKSPLLCITQLATAAVQLSRAALTQLDLRQHTATHPRLGVVDHISCNPLGAQAQLSHAADAAQTIGVRRALSIFT